MAKYKNEKLFFFFLIFLFLLKDAYAVGIYFPNDKEIDFQPGIEKKFNFRITESGRDVELYVSGYLSEYAEITKTLIKAESKERDFQVKIKLPDEIEIPGHHKIFVGAREIIDPNNIEGNIGTSSNVRVYILIHVLNPGKHIETRLITSNVNINETANFRIIVKNFGKEDISRLNAEIEIYDPENKKVETLKTQETSINSNEEKSLNAKLDTIGYLGGTYDVIATINYDENSKQEKGTFKIGKLNIELINYTKELEKDAINKINLIVESDWGNKIDNVYGEISVNGETIKTPSIDIEPWERKTLTSYIDTNGWEKGEYEAQIDIKYEGTTTSEQVKFIVLSAKKPLLEMPANISFGMITSLILLLIILVIINLVIISKKQKKEKHVEFKEKNQLSKKKETKKKRKK
jgi:hypothetical protein